MDALNPPSPQPGMTAPLSPPDKPVVTGPACAACGAGAVVHWVRRLTDDELAEVRRVESERRAEVVRLADQQQPAPDFPPLPAAEDFTRSVYACGSHAITMDAAALVHAKSCTAPSAADLPGCDCTPEPPPPPAPPALDSELPPHWVTGDA